MLLFLRQFPRIRIWERNERCLHWSQDLVTVSNSVKTPIPSAVLSGALWFRNYQTAIKEWIPRSAHLSPSSLRVRAHSEGQKIDALASNPANLTAGLGAREREDDRRGGRQLCRRESWQEQPPWFSSSIPPVWAGR